MLTLNKYYVVYITSEEIKDCFMEASSREVVEEELNEIDEDFGLIIACVNTKLQYH